MLKLTLSPVLDSFLLRLERQPERFRQVILISPFLEFPPDRFRIGGAEFFPGYKCRG